MSERTQIIWGVEPPDFVEDRSVPVMRDFGEWLFHQGHAICTLIDSRDPVPESVIVSLHKDLTSLLLARCLLTERPFLLSPHATIKQYFNDRVDTRITPSTGSITMTGGLADIIELAEVSIEDDVVIKETNSGRVLLDTAAERRSDHMKWMKTQSVLISSSGALSFMCSSFLRSLEDPNNALIHLGEIKDTLQKALGGEQAAKRAVSKAAWATLGRLANDEPILEGRHRGKHYDNLRPATPKEIKDARRAARVLITAFEKRLCAFPK